MKQHRIPFKAFATVFCSIPLLTGITSCMPDELGYQQSEGKHVVTIGTSYESPATKAEIGNDLTFSWTRGDQIAVWAGADGNGRYYTSESYVKDNLYQVELEGTRANYAIYPASSAVADAATSSSLKISLPKEYDFSRTSANFSPMPMVAANADGNSLSFKHVGGLLRISLGGLPAQTSYVVVDMGNPISGTFPVHITVQNRVESYHIESTDAENGSSRVKFIVPSSETVVLNLPVPTGNYSQIKIEAYNRSDELLIEEMQDFSWNCRRAHGKKFSMAEFSWEYIVEAVTTSAVEVQYTGGNSPVTFKSYRQRGASSHQVQEPVKFALEYSENGVDWSDSAPNWLSGPSGLQSGSVRGTRVELTAAPQVNGNSDSHATLLRSASEKSNFDLSTANTDQPSTANCYIVQAAGTYKIPLVYGNAIVNGRENEVAYHGFTDHLDQMITSPYITTQHSGGAFSAAVVWTDQINLVTDAAISGDYLTFRVPKDRICQGNAVVAVLVDKKIAWSWHIWVTDADVTATLAGADPGYQFMPINLGWCDGKVEEFAERTYFVRAAQDGAGKQSEPIKVRQMSARNETYGNSPYYQWGRKDLMLASKAMPDNNSFKPYYFGAGYTFEIITGAVSVGVGIMNPTKEYKGLGGANDWCSRSDVSLWRTDSKTIYDPSPLGFRVPPVEAFRSFTTSNTVWTAAVTTNPDGTPPGRTYTETGLFFPALSTHGNHGVYNPWKDGEFWSTTMDDEDSYAFSVHETSVGSTASDNRSHAYTLIPVKE